MSFPVVSLITYSFALWFGFYLLARNPMKPAMRYAGLGLISYAAGLAMVTLLGDDEGFQSMRTVIAVAPFVFWLLSIRGLLHIHVREDLPRRPLVILLLGTVFFFLSIGFALLPLEFLLDDLALLAIGLDLSIVAYAIAVLDAYDEGELFLRDALRSLGAAVLVAVIFGGQVVLITAIEKVTGVVVIPLLFAIVTTAIILQTLSDRLQRVFDMLFFRHTPHLLVDRDKLRAIASALPRADYSLKLDNLTEREFTRLTRRALSHLGNPSKLAASPLTRLALIDLRLDDAAQSGTLERAAELKSLLAESIEKLKPRDGGDFGTTDEWRYYNAVYYPYVVGLKPFSRRLSDESNGFREVLEWFRTYVPERTLYNWQNTAAELIAQDLREMMNSL